MNVLVGDDPSDLVATGINDALYALFDGRENDISREDEFVSRPECRSGREWRRTRIKGRCEPPFLSVPWRQVRGSAATARTRTLGFRFVFPTNGSLDQTVDDLDGLGTDFDRFATNRVGLGQS